MTKLIIGINGLAQHGKSTVAEFLKDYLAIAGYDSLVLPYAEALKNVGKYVFDLSDEQLETSEGKNSTPETTYGMTCRQVMQKLGTECFRDIFNQDIWLDWQDRRIKENSHIDIVIKPDMRFDNELDHTDKQQETHGCHSLKIKVFNPRLQNTAPGHRSETPQPDSKFDVVFLNEGHLSELQFKVWKWAMEDILPLLEKE